MFEELDSRLQAQVAQPREIIQRDDELITFTNHPLSDFNVYNRFNPSHVGKTYGEMKKREENRNIDFFKSNDLETDLKALYKSLKNCKYDRIYRCSKNCCFANQQTVSSLDSSTSHSSLDLSVANNFTDIHSPMEIQSILTGNCSTNTSPLLFSKDNKLIEVVCLRINSKSLPVMPHIQVLEWNPKSDCICDFSGWTSLRILIIKRCRGRTQIKLPINLLSFSLVSKSDDDLGILETFEDVFQDIEFNTSVFQSLKHLHLKNIEWNFLPVLSNCIFVDINRCYNLKTIEAPKCKVISVKNCAKFVGFGEDTTKSNRHLEKVVLSNSYPINIHFPKKTPFNFPPGSPSGYKLIDLYRFPVSSLPLCLDPFLYISIFYSGSHLYLNDIRSRENLAFYFDHMRFTEEEEEQEEEFDEIAEGYYPKNGESLISMANRVYGFNWPKFITKIQRQYRFKKFMRQEHKQLVSFLPKDISKHDIGKLFGAIQTFKPFKI